jgi:hypothetical protein
VLGVAVGPAISSKEPDIYRTGSEEESTHPLEPHSGSCSRTSPLPDRPIVLPYVQWTSTGPLLTSRGVDTERGHRTAHLVGPGGRYLIIRLNGRADTPTPTPLCYAHQIAEVRVPVVVYPKVA